jgi:hypothetical protein
MPLVTFVTTCMGRLAHLQRSLPTWVGQPDSNVLVVDWSCPDRCGDWVEANHPAVKVVRVPGQRHFNVSAARNLGARASDAPWLAFIDADILLPDGFAGEVFPALREQAYWRPDNPLPDLAGTVLVGRAAFEAVGGYDEALEGWGTEDGDLYQRLRWAGLCRERFSAQGMEALRHGDEVRVAHAPLRDRDAGWLVNRTYLEAKWALLRLEEEPLDLAARRDLYARVRQEVLAGLEAGRLPAMEFTLPLRRMLPGLEIERVFAFRVRPREGQGG